MFQPTWGDTVLNVVQDSYAPPVADGGINEIQVLPDSDTLDEPASVLQQAGRTRKRVGFDSWVESQAQFQALIDDHYNGEVRGFTGHDDVSFQATIYSIRPQRRVFSHYIEFSITFVEAVEIGGEAE